MAHRPTNSEAATSVDANSSEHITPAQDGGSGSSDGPRYINVYGLDKGELGHIAKAVRAFVLCKTHTTSWRGSSSAPHPTQFVSHEEQPTISVTTTSSFMLRIQGFRSNR
jgi:hypothetical protein